MIVNDINVAAALEASGYPISRVVPTEQRNRMEFEFPDEHTEYIKKFIAQYYDNKILVYARQFIDKRNILKNAVANSRISQNNMAYKTQEYGRDRNFNV